MRRAAGGQFGDVKVDRKAGMRLAIEDGPAAVRSSGADRKILEAIGLRWQGGTLRRGGGCRQSGE
jgi:hypothetical protein